MKKLILAVLMAVPMFAQTYGLPGYYRQQLFDTNGQPLNGGLVWTCAAQSACPGTPQTTYTDASGMFANENPVVADSSGTVSIWLNTSLNYKFVIQTSTGVTVETIDNISGVTSGGGGSSSTNYWTLSGTTISNNNGAGAGLVSLGGSLTVTGSGTFNTGIVLHDSQLTPNTVTITAPACEGTQGATCSGHSQAWSWPAADSAGCMTSDGNGHLSFTTCSGGGGGGSAAGPNGAIQTSNGTGGFLGTGALTFTPSTGTVTVTASSGSDAGLIVLTGYAQSDVGFSAVNNASPSTALNWNAIQAPTGGGHALSWSADNYIETGNHNGAPTATTNEAGFPHAGAMYCDTGSSPCLMKYYNGSSWITVANGGATLPGGSTCDVQYSGGAAFGGSNNFKYNCSGDSVANLVTITQPVTQSAAVAVVGGYIQTDYGLLVPSSSTTASWQNINVPSGGVYAKSLYAINYTNVGAFAGSSGPPNTAGQPAFGPASGLGALYCDTSVVPCVMRFWNGSAWSALGSGGGSGGSATGPQYALQVNNGSGGFSGTANLLFNTSSNTMTLTGTENITGSLSTTGSITSNATGSALAFQAGGGAMQIDGIGDISATNLNINGGAGNGVNVRFATNVDSIQTVGGFKAGAGSAGVSAFEVGNTAVIDRARNITGVVIQAQTAFQSLGSAANSIQSSGGFSAYNPGGVAVGGCAYAIASNCIINSSGGATFSSGVSISGTLSVTSAATLGGGLVTPFGTNSQLYIGTGSFFTRLLTSSTGLSCGAGSDGYLALASDGYIVACGNGVRSRAALVVY